MAGTLAALACLGSASAAQAAPAGQSCVSSGSAVPDAQVKFGGTLFAGPEGYLLSPQGVAAAQTRGWDSALVSSYGHYMLNVQDDGNIVLHHIEPTGWVSCGAGSSYFTYDDLGVVWASGPTYTWGTGPTLLAMQGDGNLVDYTWGMSVLWASGSDGSPHTDQYRLVVQDDGNLVVYLGSQPIWDRDQGSLR